jgi:hypothetical protein
MRHDFERSRLLRHHQGIPAVGCHKMFSTFLRTLFLIVIAPGVLTAQAPTHQEASSAAVARTLRQMQTIKLEDDLGYTVPPAAIPLLTQVKHQLRDLFLTTVNDLGAGANAQNVKAAVLGRLQTAGVAVPFTNPNDSFPYGSLVELAVEQPPQHPDLLLFSPRLGIACGDDSPLYLFRKSGNRWRLLIAVESNGYEEVKSALGELQYRVSPPDALGNWFLVYAHDSPWCTSNWNGIHYAVLRPGPDPYAPVKVFTGEHGYYRGSDFGITLRAGADSFRLDVDGSYNIYPDRLVRRHTLNYKVSDNQVTRMNPLAHSPGGFVDEWIAMEWSEAVNFSTKPDRDAQVWHEKLHNTNTEKELLFVQLCPGGKKWQVALTLADNAKVIATVAESPTGYLLAGVARTRPPGCAGADQAPAEENLRAPQ